MRCPPRSPGPRRSAPERQLRHPGREFRTGPCLLVRGDGVLQIDHDLVGGSPTALPTFARSDAGTDRHERRTTRSGRCRTGGPRCAGWTVPRRGAARPRPRPARPPARLPARVSAPLRPARAYDLPGLRRNSRRRLHLGRLVDVQVPPRREGAGHETDEKAGAGTYGRWVADLRGNGRGRGGDGGHRGSKAVKADSVWYQSPSSRRGSRRPGRSGWCGRPCTPRSHGATACPAAGAGTAAPGTGHQPRGEVSGAHQGVELVEGE